jgi:hypothetical protein
VRLKNCYTTQNVKLYWPGEPITNSSCLLIIFGVHEPTEYSRDPHLFNDVGFEDRYFNDIHEKLSLLFLFLALQHNVVVFSQPGSGL